LFLIKTKKCLVLRFVFLIHGGALAFGILLFCSLLLYFPYMNIETNKHALAHFIDVNWANSYPLLDSDIEQERSWTWLFFYMWWILPSLKKFIWGYMFATNPLISMNWGFSVLRWDLQSTDTLICLMYLYRIRIWYWYSWIYFTNMYLWSI